MNWNKLESIDQLQAIIESSHEQAVAIFKHSTRCSISSMALDRLEKDWDGQLDEVSAHYLDLIAHRDVSNAIVETFGVEHQSPQVLLIVDGKCVYNASHMGISVENLQAKVA